MTAKFASLLSAVVLAGAACGGAAESANTPDTGQLPSDGIATLDDGQNTTSGADEDVDAGDVDAETQLLAFSQCLRDQGFDVADPTVDSDGNVVPGGLNNQGGNGNGRPEGFGEAREACSEFLEGVTLGRQDSDQTAAEDQLLEFTSCMRDNGFDLPDPDPSAGAGRGVLQGTDRSDPDYQAAFEVCGDILRGAGGGNRGG